MDGCHNGAIPLMEIMYGLMSTCYFIALLAKKVHTVNKIPGKMFTNKIAIGLFLTLFLIFH